MPDAIYRELPLTAIHAPTHQLRESIDPGPLTELADSMAAEGLHQPIGVRAPEDGDSYEIIWGHRRFLAAQLLQWPSIAARVFPATYDPLLAAVSENLQRENLTAVEEAHVIRRFLDRGHSQASVARLFRRSASWVAARLSVLELPSDLQDVLRERRLPLAVVEALAAIDHDAYRRDLIAEAERTGANARTVNVWAAHYAADRDRIVGNLLTITEIAARREDYRIFFDCDLCGASVDYATTTSIRACAPCARALRDELAAAAQGGDEPPPSPHRELERR